MQKTIVFDFDGSLVDSWPVLLEIFNEMAEKYSFKKLSEDDFQKFKKMDTRELLKSQEIPTIKALKIKKYGTKLFYKKTEKIKVFDGMREVLHKLKEANYKLGIITFSPEIVVNKVLNEQELDMFDFVYCVSGLKSKTKIFKKMLKEQKIDKKYMAYVGDELRDIELAKEFGVKGISVAWGYNNEEVLREAKPDILVTAATDLYKILIDK